MSSPKVLLTAISHQPTAKNISRAGVPVRLNGKEKWIMRHGRRTEKALFEVGKNVKVNDADYEYEEDIIDPDFAEDEKQEQDDFDYDGWRMHQYDNYEGEITYEIAVRKFETLVRHYAMKYAGGGAEYEDLVQEGMLKLLYLLEECRDKRCLAAYLQKRMRGYLHDIAEKIRKEESHTHKLHPDLLEHITVQPVGFDWHERETEMFRRVRELLTKNEMEVFEMIYGGYSIRMTARMRNVSHTAIENTIARIRKKITPLIPWLEDRMEFPCTEG